jgi:hypothetical protein
LTTRDSVSAPTIVERTAIVDEHPHEKCREDDARISWTKASGDWGQVIPKMLKDKEIVVGATAIEPRDTYHVKVVRNTNSRAKSKRKGQ